jgi:hypothetical protein
MASYNIPESIIGVPLFVPDGNDFFSIEAAGMPNGDSCLVVHGDVSTNYKAYVAAQTVAPAIFTNRYSGPWAMTFWIKSSNVAHGANSGYRSDAVIFGVMNATAANGSAGAYAGTIATQPAGIGSGPILIPDIGWVVCAQGGTTPHNTVGFIKQTTYRGSTGGGGSSSNASAAAPQDTWTMVTVNVGLFVNNSVPGVATIALNDQASVVGGTAGGYNSAITWPSDPYFCIGAYSDSDGTEIDGRAGEYRLGKLAFHNHELDQTERSLLYNAMVA